MTPSYAKGPSHVPLLSETIGENLRRTVERFPDREALVVRHQDYRATFAELWRQVDAAARAFMARGVRQGDRVSIVGRIKDMIIRGGENVYPREIEEFLHGLEGVADAHVIGVPSERYGEEVMAWVRPAGDCPLDAGRLEAACRGRIASYKIPRHWRIVDQSR
jgi:acyl-CoA synthetase (AMP-forming)/AMP-acid ligase II